MNSIYLCIVIAICPRVKPKAYKRAHVLTCGTCMLLVKSEITLLIEAVIQARWYDSCYSLIRCNAVNLSVVTLNVSLLINGLIAISVDWKIPPYPVSFPRYQGGVVFLSSLMHIHRFLQFVESLIKQQKATISYRRKKQEMSILFIEKSLSAGICGLFFPDIVVLIYGLQTILWTIRDSKFIILYEHDVEQFYFILTNLFYSNYRCVIFICIINKDRPCFKNRIFDELHGRLNEIEYRLPEKKPNART